VGSLERAKYHTGEGIFVTIEAENKDTTRNKVKLDWERKGVP